MGFIQPGWLSAPPTALLSRGRAQAGRLAALGRVVVLAKAPCSHLVDVPAGCPLAGVRCFSSAMLLEVL